MTNTIEQGDLFNDLGKAIQGEVRFDQLTRHLYSTDASDYRKVPAGVVLPKNTDDIAAAIEIAGRHGISIVPRGGGSSVSGQTVGPGLVIDHTKYLNRIIEINREENWVLVDAGVSLDSLNAALSPYGQMIGPDPSSSAVATIGGMVGNNSTGSHSVKYRQISDYILEMDTVLSDASIVHLAPKRKAEVDRLVGLETLEGRIYGTMLGILENYRSEIESGFPKHWRNVAGYALNRLLASYQQDNMINLASFLAGSEGTLACTSRVKLRTVSKPNLTYLLILPFEDLSTALETVPLILEYPVSAVEVMTYPTLLLAHEHPMYGPRLAQFVKDLPGAVLIVEFNGNAMPALADQGNKMVDQLKKNRYRGDITICSTPEDIDKVWSIRKAVNGLQVSRPGDTKRISVIDDPTVPVEQLVSFTEAVTAAAARHGISVNFDAHASVGCLHLCPPINLKSAQGIKTLEVMIKEIMAITIAHQGTTTGEHGEGLARSYFNEQLYGQKLHQAFQEVKDLFDPDNRMNPYKMLNAIEPWDTDWLKYHPDYDLSGAPARTYFDFGRHGSYAGLVEMCNGQGTCRSLVIGTMCPSYRITRDELDTPRGRANVLREVMTGKMGESGLTSREAYRALDLCLECKACKKECATGLDVAKLKYEFLAQYQDKHGIPLRSRMFAGLSRTNRLARLAPGIVNRVYKQPTLRKLLDKAVKIDHRRELPAIAPQSFQSWFSRHPANQKATRGKVVLWDDCHISDHQPELGRAAVHVLETLGFAVQLAKGRKCCGRPMISKGLLKKARQYAEHNIEKLLPYAREGIAIVGIEPSCVACFRDEYPDLVPGEDATRIKDHTFFIEEFVSELVRREKIELPFQASAAPDPILVHTHCYQKALSVADQVLAFLRLIPGSTVTEVDSGCCGMAGSFGYESEHYDISMAVGEEKLFPAIRQAENGTLFSASGTSCRQQIKDGTGQTARHPIEILASYLAT